MRHTLTAVLFGLALIVSALLVGQPDLPTEKAAISANGLRTALSLRTVSDMSRVSGMELPAPRGPAESAVDNGAGTQHSGDTGTADFTLQVKDEVIPYRIFGVFVMPGEEIEIEAVFTSGMGSFRLQAEHGVVDRKGPEMWNWTAPDKPGLYPIVVSDAASGDAVRLNVFVKTPFDHDTDDLNGYMIGSYESVPLRGDPAYERPEGFVEVTPENRDTPVSPHFTLGQFLCKQQPGVWPKYVLVQERLLLKLEMILEQVNDMGYPAGTLNVMSGFRTPWYNRSIGNRTRYSQHLYGSAADVYVDIDGDAWMDDLTGDDEVTRSDAVRMANIVESQRDETWYQPFIGGLGIYSAASHRGPFIHVDVRGTPARW